jgi:hypothetical protein
MASAAGFPPISIYPGYLPTGRLRPVRGSLSPGLDLTLLVDHHWVGAMDVDDVAPGAAGRGQKSVGTAAGQHPGMPRRNKAK